MISTIVKAVVGLSLLHGAFAAPAPTSTSTFFDTTLINPTSFPALADDSKIKPLQVLAQGSLPNGPAPPPGAISAQGITNLQLIELNEFFEAAYFASLLYNITQGVPGFEIHDPDEKIYVEDALVAIVAQEQLHGIGADKNLKSQGATTIQPCQYKFPATNFIDSVAFAQTFTELVLGTLQDVEQIFASNNDVGPVRLIASVIGQEGQQDGFYRLLQNKNKIPSQLPFLSTSTRDFAFSALEQNVLASCPNDSVLKAKLKLFGVLNLLTKITEAKDQTLSFSFDLASLDKSNVITPGSKWTAYGDTYSTSYDWVNKASLVYINQQNTPVVQKLQNVQISGTTIKFDAPFPYSTNLMNGLTIGALVKGSGPFTSAAAVANATLFGPALIDIN